MFCPKCGKQNPDGASYCDNCGSVLQSLIPQPPQWAQSQPPQNLYMPPDGGHQDGRAPGKKRGLVAGLIVGGIVLVAAAIAAVLLLTGGASVAGYWFNEDRGEVIEFKTDNNFYVYSSLGEYKGEYAFDKSKGEGVITLEDIDHKFTVDKDEMDIDEIGTFEKASGSFNVDEFIAQLPTPPPVPTIEPTPVPTETVQTVAAQTMTLPFIFGECNGIYTGDVVGGLPEGYGTFICSNADGTSWTYEGYWIGGHLNGQGRTDWEYGFSEQGEYSDDLLNGEGNEYWYDRVYYSGGYLDSTSHGQGTIYNYFEEPIFTGSFSYGFIQETPEARIARLEPFKEQCAKATWKDLYDACYYENKAYTYVEGVVFDVYEYGTGSEYYCDFLMYESGVEDTSHIIQVFYRMSEGESFITEGQTVKLWGSTSYIYAYTSEGNEYLVVPSIDAWSIE